MNESFGKNGYRPVLIALPPPFSSAALKVSPSRAENLKLMNKRVWAFWDGTGSSLDWDEGLEWCYGGYGFLCLLYFSLIGSFTASLEFC